VVKKTTDSLTVLKGAGVTVVGRLAMAVIRFAISVIATRSLGTEQFGTFVTATRYTSFGSDLSRVGQHDAILHFLPRYRVERDKERARGVLLGSFLLSGGTSLAAALALYLAAPWVAVRFFADESLIPVMQILALGVPLSVGLLVLTSSLRALRRVSAAILIRMFWTPLCRLVLLVLLLTLGWGLFGLVWAVNLSFFFGFALATYVLLRDVDLFSGRGRVVFEFKKVLKFSTPILILGVVNSIKDSLDVFALGYFQSQSEVGVYGLALRLLPLVGLPVGAMLSMYVPIAAELHADSQLERLRLLYRTASRWAFTGALALYVLLVLFAEPLLAIFGKDFMGGAGSLRIMGIIPVSNSLAMLSGYAVFMSGRSWIVLWNGLFLLALSAIFYWLLIPTFSIMGAAAGRATAFLIFNLLVLVEGYVLFKLQPFQWGLLKPLAAVGASGLAATAVQRATLEWGSLAGSLLAIAAFSFTYVTTLALLGLTEEDREVINQIKSRFRKATEPAV
jgi:O-antigen/teichoic acid export membrane protein